MSVLDQMILIGHTSLGSHIQTEAKIRKSQWVERDRQTAERARNRGGRSTLHIILVFKTKSRGLLRDIGTTSMNPTLN